MKTEYRKLGEYIQSVDVRNSDLRVSRLLGLSIEKCFIESIANTIGTDFRPYKIVKKGQFAYGPVTSRNGDKITIALLEEPECIISSSYAVFEITDTSKLLPEYLMLWFSRPEFDRYARFKSHGSVREIFDWDEICRVELPVPDLTQQQHIVNAYNIVNRRIQLLQQINGKLLKLGITLVEENISKSILLNMTDNEISNTEELLPNGWNIKSIADFCKKTESGSTPSRTDAEYWENGNIPWVKSGEVHNNVTLFTEEYITEKALKETSTKLLPVDTVLMAMYGVTAGEVGYLNIEATTNQAICGMVCKSEDDAAYLYFSLLQNQEQISSMSNGGAQNNLSKNFIENLKIIVPKKDVIQQMKLALLIKQLKQNYEELSKLQNLKQLIISRISGM